MDVKDLTGYSDVFKDPREAKRYLGFELDSERWRLGEGAGSKPKIIFGTDL